MNLQGTKRVTPIKTVAPKMNVLRMPASRQAAPAPSTSRSKRFGQPFKSFIGPNWFPKEEPEDMDDVARESREALTRENLLALIDEAEKDVRANPALLEKIWINTQPKKKDLMSSTDGKLRKLNPITPRLGLGNRGEVQKDKSVDQEEEDVSHLSVVDVNQPEERATETKPRDSQWNMQIMQHLLEEEEPVGELRREHFQQLADMLKEKISEAEIDELLREADFDGNGSIKPILCACVLGLNSVLTWGSLMRPAASDYKGCLTSSSWIMSA